MNWKIKKTLGNVAIVGESGGIVAKSIKADPLCYQDSDVENAQLMASAPELLSILKRIVTYYQDETRAEAIFKLDQAREAIDRAHNV